MKISLNTFRIDRYIQIESLTHHISFPNKQVIQRDSQKTTILEYAKSISLFHPEESHIPHEHNRTATVSFVCLSYCCTGVGVFDKSNSTDHSSIPQQHIDSNIPFGDL